MKKSKIKKILKVVITILILLILALIIYQIYIRYDGRIDKSNPMNKSEIIELLKKGEQYNNYVITYKPNKSSFTTDMIMDEKLIQKIYVKDYVVKGFIGDKEWSYSNYNTKESIQMFDYLQAYISDINEEFGMMKYYRECVENEELYSYEYIGEKEISNRKIIVIKLFDNKYNTNEYIKCYIDKQTGVGYNSIYFQNIIGPIFLKHDDCMSVEFDCVTDEDVKRPNIAGCVIYDSRENN